MRLHTASTPYNNFTADATVTTTVNLVQSTYDKLVQLVIVKMSYTSYKRLAAADPRLVYF